MNGWVKLYRKLWEWPYSSDPDYVSVWIYLITHATHQNSDVIFNGQRVTLKAGQLVTGRKVIAEKTGVTQSKVQRILKRLEIEQQIEQQTSSKNRLIALPSWTRYQDSEQQSEQQVNNKRTTSEQQVNTYNNVKNGKNAKEVITPNPKGKPKRKTAIPSDFTPDTSYAADYGIEDTAVAIEIFTDWAVAGNKTYADWNLTWKSACRDWLPAKVVQALANQRRSTVTQPDKPKLQEPAKRVQRMREIWGEKRQDLLHNPWNKLSGTSQQYIIEKCKEAV